MIRKIGIIAWSFMISGSLFLMHANDYTRANKAAKEAFEDLDCEFEDCKKEEPRPKVIIKERVVEKPVIQKVIVEKPVVKEKIVYKEKVVYKAKPKQEQKAIGGVSYNKAFFDIHPKSQAPILDYITYSDRASFNVEQYVDSVSKIHDENIKVYIYGKLEVPSSIKTNQVYIYSGERYEYHSCCNHWVKEIYYNDSKTYQNADYFLVNVQEDNHGRRFVKYKIRFHLEYPWKIKPSEENVAPNVFFFKMAPKARGYKNKFVKVKPYIVEE